MNIGHLESFRGFEAHGGHLGRPSRFTQVGVAPSPSGRMAQISLGTMKTPSSFSLCVWILAAGVVLPQTSFAQTDTTQTEGETWWKGLFRGGQETPQPIPKPTQDSMDTTTLTKMDSVVLTPAQVPPRPDAVLATWSMPDTLRSLDSLAKLDPAPLQGFRVQIYFGDLQEARAVRAAFNRACPDVASHLHPIDPNYAVTVGNFRDAWSAQRAVQSGALGAWDNVLVIPSEIDLPALK